MTGAGDRIGGESPTSAAVALRAACRAFGERAEGLVQFEPHRAREQRLAATARLYAASSPTKYSARVLLAGLVRLKRAHRHAAPKRPDLIGGTPDPNETRTVVAVEPAHVADLDSLIAQLRSQAGRSLGSATIEEMREYWRTLVAELALLIRGRHPTSVHAQEVVLGMLMHEAVLVLARAREDLALLVMPETGEQVFVAGRERDQSGRVMSVLSPLVLVVVHRGLSGAIWNAVSWFPDHALGQAIGEAETFAGVAGASTAPSSE